MTIEEMIKIKEDRGYSFAVLSQYSGVPKITIQKIFSGNTKRPRKSTLDALEKVLSGSEDTYKGRSYEYGLRSRLPEPSMIKQTPASYENLQKNPHQNDEDEDNTKVFSVSNASKAGGSSPEQVQTAREQALSFVTACREASIFGGSIKDGELYTIDDYYALPDERRVELINGVIYDLSTPSLDHQLIIGEIYRQISNQIKEQKLGSIPVVSPVDVKLSDEYTIVHPDILILCDHNKIRKWGIEGTPDFIAEILSPSTAKKDTSLKYMKYYTCGVREYWIIDPDRKVLIVYNFMDTSMIPKIVPLEGQHGLAIYENKVLVDLDEAAAVLR